MRDLALVYRLSHKVAPWTNRSLTIWKKEADEKIEVLKHYFGITYEDELVVRGIETRRHDVPKFIKQFQTQLLYTIFDGCKDSSEVVTKGYETALLLVTQGLCSCEALLFTSLMKNFNPPPIVAAGDCCALA